MKHRIIAAGLVALTPLTLSVAPATSRASAGDRQCGSVWVYQGTPQRFENRFKVRMVVHGVSCRVGSRVASEYVFGQGGQPSRGWRCHDTNWGGEYRNGAVCRKGRFGVAYGY
jgi:hypothetical protein